MVRFTTEISNIEIPNFWNYYGDFYHFLHFLCFSTFKNFAIRDSLAKFKTLWPTKLLVSAEVYVMNGDLDGVNPKVVRKDSRQKQREKSFRFWYRVWAHTSPYRGKLCWQDRIGWPLGYRLFWPWSKVPWPNFGCRSALASAGGLPHPRTNL